MADYVFYYGGYESGNLYPHVKTYFEEGGARAYVQRAVSDAGNTAGTLTLNDRDATPAATLRIDAENDGDWSDNLDIQVTDGVTADTFKILVYLDNVLIYTSRDLTTPADAVAVINTSAVKHLIVATDLASASVAPDNNPAVLAATALSGGADGAALDIDDYEAALDLFSYELGPGAVAIPGQTASTFWTALIDHAGANNRIALCAFGPTDSVATVKTDVASFYSDPDAKSAAFYYPYVKIPDPATSGLELSISPEVYVAGKRAQAVLNGGPWRAAAGLVSKANYVTDLASDIDRATGDGLDEKRINAIRKIGKSIRVYGARSVDDDEDNWRYITMQDTINMIVWEAEQRLENYVFETIDSRGSLFGRIRSALIGLLDPIRVKGGLYEAFDGDGEMVDPGYSVVVDDTVNPIENLAAGIVNAVVGVRVSSIGDKIEVTITKANLTASVI